MSRKPVCLVLSYAEEGGMKDPRSAFLAFDLTQARARDLLDVTTQSHESRVLSSHPLIDAARYFSLAEGSIGRPRKAASPLGRWFTSPERIRWWTLATPSAVEAHREHTDSARDAVLRRDTYRKLEDAYRLTARIENRFPGGGRMTSVSSLPFTRPLALQATLLVGPPEERSRWFRELVEIAPISATGLITRGARVVGDAAGPIRIDRDLDREALLGLLTSEVSTHRQAALAALAEVGREFPEANSSDRHLLR